MKTETFSFPKPVLQRNVKVRDHKSWLSWALFCTLDLKSITTLHLYDILNFCFFKLLNIISIYLLEYEFLFHILDEVRRGWGVSLWF